MSTLNFEGEEKAEESVEAKGFIPLSKMETRLFKLEPALSIRSMKSGNDKDAISTNDHMLISTSIRIFFLIHSHCMLQYLRC